MFEKSLWKKIENNRNEIDFIVKHNAFLVDHTMKSKLLDHCSYIGIETMFINMKNIEGNEPHNFFVKVLQKLNLKSHDKFWHNCRQLKVFKNDEKCFLFHILKALFVHNIFKSLTRRIRLVLKCIRSQPGH